MFFKVPGTRYFLISKIEGEVVSLQVEIIGQIASGLSTDCYLGLLPGRSYLCFNIIFKCGYETEILFKIKLIIGGGKNEPLGMTDCFQQNGATNGGTVDSLKMRLPSQEGRSQLSEVELHPHSAISPVPSRI